ncbi:hypothetical protein NliqN6_2163 [Naganishia liquefaciens]|uniref:Uncharacterized protein n=1 Tax=Naganishia liquefaciens TaxID=104408 RepID=A0A8H3TRR8_9TREE|nr:hypothetical protein NliqN6_2163 [Naganishia liquefaciens]
MSAPSIFALLQLFVLGPLAYIIDLAATPISNFYPFPLATTLHAARVGLAYKGRVKALGFDGAMKARGRAVEWAGYLVMCWGGSFITSFLQQTPPPQLLSPLPWINYISTYLFVTNPGFVALLPSPAILDTILPIVDGLTRSFPISGAVLSSSAHGNPAIRSSVMFQILLGGLSASGGGLAATTLNVFNPEWRLSTPPILFSGIMGSLDFVAGCVAAVIFGFLTGSHPAYAPFVQAARTIVLGADVAEKPSASNALMTVLGARSVVVFFLSIVYAWRAFVLHWYPSWTNQRQGSGPLKNAQQASKIVVQEKKRA